MKKRKKLPVWLVILAILLAGVAVVTTYHIETIRILAAPQTIEMRSEAKVVSAVCGGAYKDVSFDEAEEKLHYRTQDEALYVKVEFEEAKVQKIIGQIDPAKMDINDMAQGMAYAEQVLEPFLTPAEIDALKLKLAAQTGALTALAGQPALDFQTDFGRYDITVSGTAEAPAFVITARP